MRRFPFPVLVADVGGTNARFALIRAAGERPEEINRLATAGHESFSAAARAAIAGAGWPAPRSALIGAAGPVADRAVSLTNARWRIHGPDVARDLGLDQGLLLNDFETLSLALPALRLEDLRPIGPARGGSGSRLVVGPGTGLGVGALLDVVGRVLPVASEGGHVGLAPESAEERAVYERIGYRDTRAQAEMLLAGPAMPAIYRALAAIGGAAPVELQPAEIVARAAAGTDAVAGETVAFQLRLLARFSGDMALAFMATGGAYLAGGILPRLGRLLDEAAFRRAFERNERHQALLQRMPVNLIVAEEPALIGLAALASEPDAYLIDYARRLWI